jgi:glycerophosphoryl diester phosphodiesterase
MNRPGGRIEVIGHGGAGDFFPGNSRPSIEQALKIGVDRIEFDVQRAADGEIVLVHDEHVRLPDGRRVAVRAATTAQLREALSGLLTFSEAVALIGTSAALLIDVKAPGYEAGLIAEMRRLGIDNSAAVSCTYVSVLRAVARAFPAIRLGLSTGHISTGVPTKLAKVATSALLRGATPLPLLVAARAVHATDVMVQYRACSPLLVRTMHRHGIRVNAWTVDHPRHIGRMIDLGVDGIISNRPDLVHDQLDGRSG